MTRDQAEWILANAFRIRALTIGLGSNGYPPRDDGAAFVILTDNSSLWLYETGRAVAA